MTEMNVEVKRMLIPNTLLTLSSVFVCAFIKISSALRTYCGFPVFPLSGCGVWDMRMLDARSLT